MKTLVCFLFGLCLGVPIFAQQDSAAPSFPPEELDKLVAPIALYPDSLVALILPASTTSADVVIAARYFAAGGEQDDIDNQPWADSVKSLAHYPDVVKWMDENLAWTRQMGEVFEAQPADVMNAIQRMRAQAKSAGLLTDTPQQRVIMQEEEICIVPAEPDIIYVPRYDPEILWMRRPYRGDFISFGVGFGVGSWLYFDCDWWGRSVWVQHRDPGWVYRPGWRRPAREWHEVGGEHWRPDPRRFHPEYPRYHSRPVAVRPRMIEESHRDFSGRPDHRPVQPSGPRFGPSVGNPQNRPVRPPPPQRNFNPPPAVDRAHHEPPPQPQPQIQPPHDQQREFRRYDRRPAPQMPHPPSHTPITNATPPPSRVPPPAAVSAPAGRPAVGSAPASGNVSNSGRGSPPPSAPAAKSTPRDNGNDNRPGRAVGPRQQP